MIATRTITTCPECGSERASGDLHSCGGPASDKFCWLAPECHDLIMQQLQTRRFTLKSRIADGMNCEKNQRADRAELVIVEKAIQELMFNT